MSTATATTEKKTPPPAPTPGAPGPSLRDAKSVAAANGSPANAKVSAYQDLQIAEVHASPLNPRKQFDEVALEELAASIKVEGVLQAIVVRPRGHSVGGGYEIVMGERRWRASKIAGSKTIPARIVAGLTDADVARMALAENLDRRDLNPIEEARGYHQILRLSPDLTKEKLASDLGKSRPAVSNLLRLLELPAEVQDLIYKGKLTSAHGMALLRFKDWPDLLRPMAEFVVKEGESAGQIERGMPCEYKLKGKGLLFECTEYSIREAAPWKKLAAANPKKFIVMGDDVYCLDPMFAKAKIAEEEKAQIERDKAELEKAKTKAGGKLTAGAQPVLNFDNNYSEQQSWTPLSQIPAEFRSSIPREVLRLAKEEYTNNGKPYLVVPRGVANALNAKSNRGKNKILRARVEAVYAAIEENWGNAISGCKLNDLSAMALVAQEVLKGFSASHIEAAATTARMELPKLLLQGGPYGSGLAGTYQKQCRNLADWGGVKAIRLAALCIMDKGMDGEFANSTGNLYDRLKWYAEEVGILGEAEKAAKAKIAAEEKVKATTVKLGPGKLAQILSEKSAKKIVDLVTKKAAPAKKAKKGGK